ncbi:hypothetical protein UlMin_023932 [Ulmus minor]
MTIDKSWTTIRRRGSSTEFWNGLQHFLQMAKPFVNDRGFIKCPCRRCLNNASHQLEDLESHIFRNGFMFGYNQWIHHGEPATANAGTTVPGPSGGIPETDEMFDVLDDIISEDADEDAVGGPSANDQYDDLFAALRSELHPGVSSFSSLNFLESQRIMMLCGIRSMASHGRNLINGTLNLPVT